MITSIIYNTSGTPEVTRTPDTWLRRPLLYPTELPRYIKHKMERHKGLEPSTSAWKAEMLPLHQCRINGIPFSTNSSIPQK